MFDKALNMSLATIELAKLKIGKSALEKWKISQFI